MGHGHERWSVLPDLSRLALSSGPVSGDADDARPPGKRRLNSYAEDKNRDLQYLELAEMVERVLGSGQLRRGYGVGQVRRESDPGARQGDNATAAEVTQLINQIVQWALENADYLRDDLWRSIHITDAVMTLLVLVRDRAMALRTWNRHVLNELIMPLLNPRSNRRIDEQAEARWGHARRVRRLREWEAERKDMEAKEADARRQREERDTQEAYEREQRRLGADALSFADEQAGDGSGSDYADDNDGGADSNYDGSDSDNDDNQGEEEGTNVVNPAYQVPDAFGQGPLSSSDDEEEANEDVVSDRHTDEESDDGFRSGSEWAGGGSNGL